MKSKKPLCRKTFAPLILFCRLFPFFLPAFGKEIAAVATLEKPDLLFVGTYTKGPSLGIYLFKMDTATGSLTQVSTSPSGKANNPSFLAIHPNKKWIYAVCEQSPGSVSAFSFDSATKQMTFLNSVSSHGDLPCHVSVDNSGRYAMAANWGNGSVAVLPINSDGSLKQASSFDQHPGSARAHMIFQAGNGYVYNTDMGLDKIYIYNLDTASGVISNAGRDASVDGGSGPRHMDFHPTQPWVYVVCELGGAVKAFSVNNSTGGMTLFQSISTGGASCADIHISPDGKFLYASNRGGNNNIAMYSIDQTNGKLALLGHQATLGNTPRNFVIDPTGTFLLVANQDGNSVVTFKINPATGLLISTGIQTSVPSPVCLKFYSRGTPVGTGIRSISTARLSGLCSSRNRVSTGACLPAIFPKSLTTVVRFERFDLQGKRLGASERRQLLAPEMYVQPTRRGE